MSFPTVEELIRRDVAITTALMAAAAAAVLLIAALTGHVGLDRPLDCSKLLSAIGGLLAGWGTYFMLQGPYPAGDATADHPLRKRLFTATFVPGVLCALLGAIW